jgi:hypothetical protein
MPNGLYMREAYMHVHCLLAKGWSAQVHDYWLHDWLLGCSLHSARQGRRLEDSLVGGLVVGCWVGVASTLPSYRWACTVCVSLWTVKDDSDSWRLKCRCWILEALEYRHRVKKFHRCWGGGGRAARPRPRGAPWSRRCKQWQPAAVRPCGRRGASSHERRPTAGTCGKCWMRGLERPDPFAGHASSGLALCSSRRWRVASWTTSCMQQATWSCQRFLHQPLRIISWFH